MTRSLSSLLLAGASLLAANRAAAALPLGDGAEAFATLKTGVQYNDNLFLNSTGEVDETIFEAAPGVEILFGQNSLAQGSFTYVESFKWYNDNSNIDGSLSTVNANVAYDNDKLAVTAKAGYQQLDQATRDVRSVAGLIKRDVIDASISAESSFTEKTSVKLGVSYNDTDYKPAGFADLERIQIPVTYYYEVAPKLDASVGFLYKDNTVGAGAIDSKEYVYSVGARGDLAPKLTGEVTVGYHQFDPTTGDDDSTVGVTSSFSYAFSQKTTLTFGVNNDYTFSGTGDSYRNLAFNGGANFAISAQLSVNANLSYTNSDYQLTNREDNMLSGQLGANYRYNDWISFAAAYSYLDNESDLALSNFTGNTVSLSASFRY